jgi:hypothetical protein
LQETLPELKQRGLGLAAISYDAPDVLKAFADARGITFPLLSDKGSATIRRYNLLNTEAEGPAAGVPYPGTFVLDAKGIVVSRSFEERYTERASAASLLAQVGRLPNSAAPAETKHLSLTTAASDTRVAPGTRLSLIVDITPKPKMHVYSPEQKDFIPVSLKLEPGEFTAHPVVFPRPEKYFFKPLNETHLVFSRAFRLVQDVTMALTPALRERARQAGATVTIAGTLEYQACDDTICYLPERVPVSWTIGLRALER